MKRISIIIPLRNEGEFLLKAVMSVLDSGIDDLECIVVEAECNNVASEALPIDDSRLIVYRSNSYRSNCGGDAPLINAGLAIATGEVLGILNADDFYEVDALKNVLRDFEQSRDCVSLYGQVNLVDAESRPIRHLRTYPPTLSHLRERTCLQSSAFFFRRSLIEQLGNFDESVIHWPHYDFWLRMALARVPFVCSKSLLAGKRVYPPNDNKKLDLELAKTREAWELTLAKLGESSVRWAIAYGRCAAAKAGHTRTQTAAFDYVALQSAICDLIPVNETNLGRWSRISRILKQHSLSEINRIRKRPRCALRFLPSSSGDRIRKNLGRRLFQLRYEEPNPCLLPASFFSPSPLEDAPTIAIVTPNLNQGKFIERTLKSVLDQDYPALEYVVQDGCSNDNSLEVIRKYESHLASWESVRDKGQSQAINFGLARTSSEIMAYLNSDDTLVPGSLAYVAKFFQDHPNVDVVYGNRLLIDEQDQVINYWVLPAHDRETLRWADYIPQETMFWRRRAWDAVSGCIDESFQFAMDWDLILRFQAAGLVFQHLPRFLGAFRITDSQKTSQLINTFGLREMNRLRKRELGFCPTDREVSRKVKSYIRRQRYTEKIFQISESISKMVSPYREWKIEVPPSVSVEAFHAPAAA